MTGAAGIRPQAQKKNPKGEALEEGGGEGLRKAHLSPCMPTTDGTVVRGVSGPPRALEGQCHPYLCSASPPDPSATLPDDQVSQGLQDGHGHPKTAPPAEEGWAPTGIAASDPSTLSLLDLASEASTSRKLSLL